MKQTVKCLPCFLNAAVNCMDRLQLTDAQRYDYTVRLLPLLAELPTDGTPSANASRFLRALYDMDGAVDPYAAEKRESNLLAAALLPSLRQELERADDRLYTALKLSAAGNIIDLAVNDSYDILPAVQHCLAHPFAIDDYAAFRALLHPGVRVLICGDNAGEIVFDTLLVEELHRLGARVTFMVKAGPMMNDATMEDAAFSGMQGLCRVVTTGRAEMGFQFASADEAALAEFSAADVIIAKGQANFEGLDDAAALSAPAFFLFKLKCAAICSYTGASLGDVVFIRKKDPA